MNKLLVRLGIIKENKGQYTVCYTDKEAEIIQRALDFYCQICDTGFKNKGGASAHKAFKHKS